MAKRGRPTKYNVEILGKTERYIEDCWEKNKIPWIEELAMTLGVNDDTIVEWTNRHPEFSATIKRLKTLQRLRLQQGSLNQSIAPAPAIFLMKANHGLSERNHLVVEGRESLADVIEQVHKRRTGELPVT